jgi:hypothetical protein
VPKTNNEGFATTYVGFNNVFIDIFPATGAIDKLNIAIAYKT